MARRSPTSATAQVRGFRRHELLGQVTVLDRKLPTGARLLIVPAEAPGPVAIALWVLAGTGAERPGEHGCAHLLEHMLFKPGIIDGRPTDLALGIESLGGDVNAFTSHDETVFHATVPSASVGPAIDLLARGVLRPTLDSSELGKEIEVVVEEINQYDDDPTSVASQRALELAYAGHPYGRPVLGSRAEVRSTSAKTLRGFHRRAYAAERTALVVVGATDPSQVYADAVASMRGQGKRGRVVQAPVPQAPARSAVEVLAKNVHEAQVQLAWVGPALPHPDAAALEAASIILGFSEAARLSARVRRQAELVTDASAHLYASRQASAFVVGFSSMPKRTEAAAELVLDEVARLSREPVEPDELRRAQAVMRSEAVYRRDTVQALAHAIGYQLSLSGDLDGERRYFDAVDALSPAGVRRACAEHLDLAKASVGAVVPGKVGGRAQPKGGGLRRTLGRALRSRLRARGSGRAAPRVRKQRTGILHVDFPSGFRVRILQDAKVPMAAGWLVWPGGLRRETPRSVGTAPLIGTLLTRGCEAIGGDELAAEVDGLAAVLEGFSGRNSLGLHFESLADDFGLVLRRALQCAAAPHFDAEEFERERAMALDELVAEQDDIGGLTFAAALEAVYRGHPFRLRRRGTQASLQGLGARALRSKWEQGYPLPGAVLGLCGDVDVDAVVSLVDDALQGPRRAAGSGPTMSSTNVRYPARAKACTVRGAREQTHLVLAFGGLPMADPRCDTLEVLLAILGGQAGRLFNALRERDGLVYSVSAGSLEGIDAGHVAIYAATGHAKRDQALAAMRGEVDLLVRDGVTAEEMRRAKAWLIGQHEVETQRRSRVASLIAFDEVYGLGCGLYLQYRRRIKSVTRADVAALATELLIPQRCVTAVGRP